MRIQLFEEFNNLNEGKDYTEYIDMCKKSGLKKGKDCFVNKMGLGLKVTPNNYKEIHDVIEMLSKELKIDHTMMGMGDYEDDEEVLKDGVLDKSGFMSNIKIMMDEGDYGKDDELFTVYFK